MAERIQKIISASGLMSRRAAETAIAAGRVTLNGRTAVIGDSAGPDDSILVDGEALPQQGELLYILLNKPRGVVTTLNDEKGRRNVSALVNVDGARLYPVGRLDMDSEGLLLLTNDGAFANRVMHPSHEIDKTYLVWVRGENLDSAAGVLAGPLEIDGYPIRPATVEIKERFAGGGVLSVTIHEGRNRQIRKMSAQAGLTVTRLVRVAEGGVRLGDLRSGCWRHLTPQEIKTLLDEGER